MSDLLSKRQFEYDLVNKISNFWNIWSVPDCEIKLFLVFIIIEFRYKSQVNGNNLRLFGNLFSDTDNDIN